ncbi:MAG: adenosylcobinamide amidohydrolase [Haloarculaceae archaeon]
MFRTHVSADVLQVLREDARWLATGFDGGLRRADVVYNVTVPEGFGRTDLDAYVAERTTEAGFDRPGISLLTGVSQRHARGARLGPVAAVATAGLSNPATLPLDPDVDSDGGTALESDDASGDASDPPVGTVNVVVGTTRALESGALATLLSTAVEAKTATLLQAVGFTGTTSDAVVVGCDPDGDAATFAGSASEVGRAARACVREALRAALASRYAETTPPESVADARFGVVTDRRAEVFEP